MSRVAKNPIEIADGVTVNFNDGCLDVKGKVGELKFDLPETVSLDIADNVITCLLYTSPSPRDATLSRMPSSA